MKSKEEIQEKIDKLTRAIKKMNDTLFDKLSSLEIDEQRVYSEEIAKMEMQRGMLEWTLK